MPRAYTLGPSYRGARMRTKKDIPLFQVFGGGRGGLEVSILSSMSVIRESDGVLVGVCMAAAAGSADSLPACC